MLTSSPCVERSTCNRPPVRSLSPSGPVPDRAFPARRPALRCRLGATGVTRWPSAPRPFTPARPSAAARLDAREAAAAGATSLTDLEPLPPMREPVRRQPPGNSPAAARAQLCSHGSWPLLLPVRSLFRSLIRLATLVTVPMCQPLRKLRVTRVPYIPTRFVSVLRAILQSPACSPRSHAPPVARGRHPRVVEKAAPRLEEQSRPGLPSREGCPAAATVV